MNDVHPDRAVIQARQAAALRAMAAELVPRNPFYAPKLERFARHLQESVGETAPAMVLERFSALVPFTVKPEIVADQQAHPPYGTNLTYPLDCYVRYTQTSGTTGAPIRWLDTPESWGWMVENWTQVLEASGVRRGDRIFFAFSFGPFLGFWTAFAAGERIGCLCIPGGGMSSAARAQAILDNQATVLCCTPTYAIRLGEAAAEAGIALSSSRVRAIVVGGEPGAGIPATRARIEALWPGARLWDHHGMTEIGPVTFECSERRGVLHILESAFIPEIIAPATGELLEAGAEGELVLTNLGRLGSPLIRYRTGDIVRPSASAPCACGRYDMALEAGILGRTDDMVVVRGVNLYPAAVEAVVRQFEQVAEYRVEIRTMDALPEVTLLLEPRTDCGDTASLAARVQEALRDTFNLRFPVSLVAPDSLPRFEMKAQRWERVTGDVTGTPGPGEPGLDHAYNGPERRDATMGHPRFSNEEIARRGEEIYERELRHLIEPGNEGKLVVIDIETGEYVMDADEVQASRRAMAKHPEHARYMKRIGYKAVHTFGGSLLPLKQ